MPVDDFAFDAYDRLVGRASMAVSPVSVIVRGVNERALDDVLERSLELVAERQAPDEILLAVGKEPPRRPPASIGRLRVRTLVHPKVADKEGLGWLLDNARWPLAVFVGRGADLPPTSFNAMLESLEHADIVVGRRRGLRGRRNPISWMVRRLFGVSIRDPLSPYFGVRRETVAGVPLQLDEPLTTFELLAKATFSFAIYDEIDVGVGDANPAALHRVFRENWRSLARLFRRPHFWTPTPGGPWRVAPQETKPPIVRALAGGGGPRVGRGHPLRSSLKDQFRARGPAGRW